MPEVLFQVRMPDGEVKNCYSPSTVVRDYFQTGEEMSLDEFVIRSRTALSIASERVRAKFGFSCSSAQDQLSSIVGWAAGFPAGGTVRIIGI